MTQHRNCDYCGFSAFGAYKCLSCGAPSHKPGQREGIKMDLLYGFLTVRPRSAAWLADVTLK